MASAGVSWSGLPSSHLSPPHFWSSGEFPAVEALALGAFRPRCAQGPWVPHGACGCRAQGEAAHATKSAFLKGRVSLENLGLKKRLSKFSEEFDLF